MKNRINPAIKFKSIELPRMVQGIMLLLIITALSSCMVTNQMYFNNPVPADNTKLDIYAGLGTGFQPKIDSVATDGTVNFSNKISQAPNLCLGTQVSLAKRTDLRIAINFPYIIGGFGMRLGPQYSFFDRDSKIEMAIGSDLGFVISKDSITLFGSTSAVDKEVNGAINADFFLPIGIKLGTNTQIIITPRYSFNTIFIRKNTLESNSQRFNPQIPSLALGIKFAKLYLEASVYKYLDNYYPNAGLVYVFQTESQKKQKNQK